MITKQHLKIFLSFLSLVVLLLGGCSAEDKLGSETQSPQVSGSSSGRRTNLPIWTTSYTYGSEISKDGLIPEIWWGTYHLVFSDYDGVKTTAEVTSDSVTWYNTYRLANYRGNNIWYFDGGYDLYVEFTLNEKGQRILKTDERGSGDKERYNMVYVHSEDKDK